jgi:diguanylate cyclase (GGDEF)-like protein
MQAFQTFETAGQLAGNGDPGGYRLGSFLATIQGSHHVGELSLLTAAVLAALLLWSTLWMWKLSRTFTQRQASLERELQMKNHQLQMLQHKVSSFDDARNGYLNLITNMSFVLRNVNFRQKPEDLASTISSLVKNMLRTEVVEFYTYDPSDDLLKKVEGNGPGSRGQIVRPLGQGLVGTAAKDRMIITNDYFNRKYLCEEGRPKAGARLWMAAPIQFEKQLLGVIAVGEPQALNGTEKDLLSIVAQIAGVVLFHQSFLIRAQRNADTDVLTGLHNRRYFYRMSREFVEKAAQDRTSFSILLIDLDHFKSYNDTNGHDEGDRLLIEMSGLLRGCTPDDAVVARYGGEEFIIMLPGVPAEDAIRYAEYLRKAVASHPFPHRERQPAGLISISGGIACFPDHGRSVQEVVRLADASLYKAKNSGRNRIVAHGSSLFMEEYTVDGMQAEEEGLDVHPAGGTV